jgi:hypothetical protein
MSHKSISLQEKLNAHIDRSGECWVWTAGRTALGYGQLWFDGRMWYAHRCMWIVTYGPIPAGMEIAHACDNPPCLRPDHLFLASHRENLADAVRKGRVERGNRHHAAKLTEEDIPAIRALIRDGRTRREVASRYGVSRWTIGEVVHGRAWKHVK